MPKRGHKLLVTGAAGFVGSHVVEAAVEAGYPVIALVRSCEPRVKGAGVTCEQVEWSGDDLARAIDEFGPDGIIHAAGHSGRFVAHVDLNALYDANVSTVWRLLDAARRSGSSARVVIVSSAAVYGPCPPTPTTEEAPLAPATHYATSKVAAESIATGFATLGDAAALIARPFNALGPGEPPGSVVSRITEQLQDVRPGGQALMHLREKASARDFVDVDDLARALVVLSQRGQPGQAYNVCSGHSVTVAELVERAAEAFGRRVRLEVEDPDAPGTVSKGDPSRLRALGWRPTISLDETLTRMAAAGSEPVR